MSKTPRTDDQAVRIMFGMLDTVVPVEFARQLETELADKDRQLAEARAENWRLQTQCEIIKDTERHQVRQWYYGKLAALHAWAKKQPDDVSEPIFACLACGSPSVYETPEYSQMLDSLKHALEKSEKKFNEARARIDHLERIVDEMTEEQAALCAEDQSITELVAAKDKLIEQMREALENIRDYPGHIDYTTGEVHSMQEIAIAALAAERGE